MACEPNWEAHLINTPNDPLLSSMYPAGTTAAGRIFLREAWDLSTGSADNVVGIIDTGLDYTHPDLAANVWTNPSEIAANGIDDDGNGYTDDLHGYDFINGDSIPLDDHSHGTAIAGTIGAVGNNALGVVGVNWNVKMAACKAFSAAGTGSVAAIVSCLNYLTALKRDYGINIVATNNSYGGFPYSIAFYNAIAATRDQGIVFAAGAGNYSANNDTTPFYPASFELDNIITVAATDSAGLLTSFSNYGATAVDIAAPGIAVLTTGPNNQYGLYQGTSIATPHVTGAVALVLAYHPEYTYSQAIAAIRNSGTVMSGLNGKCASSAILNVAQALAYAAPTPPPNAPDPPTGGDGEIDYSSGKIEIAVTNMKNRSVVRCDLSAPKNSEYATLPNQMVRLTRKGSTRKMGALTDADGAASFIVRPPKGSSYSVRCTSGVTKPETGEVYNVHSRAVRAGSRAR